MCGLCNKSVDFLLRVDTKHRLKFSPLQGETAALLVPNHSQSLESFIYWKSDKVYEKSSAILVALSDVGGFWKMSKILLIIPTSIRNIVYMWVARNRYKWFGKSERCRMPTSEERSRFLD
jgi:predicted DCC family thiol-disulfide oxidoreductase YuxK